jgi:hypothetical protein
MKVDADGCGWKAAELITAELASGKTQKEPFTYSVS